MMTTAALANTSHHVITISLWGEQLKYSLGNFEVCNTVLLNITTILYIRSPGLIC